MTGFAVGAAALLAVALLCVLPSLLRRRSEAVTSGSDADTSGGAAIAVLREQLAQLDTARAAGELSAEAHATAVSDIERRALDEAGPEPAMAMAMAMPMPMAMAMATDGTAAHVLAGAASAPASTSAASTSGSTAARPHAPPERALAAGVALCVCAVAVGLYLRVGNRGALQPPAPAAAGVTQQQVEAMVDQMAQRMATDPGMAGNLQGWTMLGRSAAALQRFAQARMAFDHAIALAPKDAQLLVDQADVIAMTQNRRLTGEPMRLVERALQIDPKNLKALAMAGSDAFDQGDYPAAIARWTAARRTAESGSELANGLDQSIAEAQRAARNAAGGTATPTAAAGADGIAAGASPPSADSVATASSGGTASADTPSPALSGQAPGLQRIVGRITVAPALAGRVAPDDTVFVYARAANGPRMPLAIVRRSARALPFDFVLDDSTAMSPSLKLSTIGADVVVGARISHSGNALPQSGDLQAAPRLPPPGGAERRLDVAVDAVVP